MKKYIAILLVLFLALQGMACGGKESSKKDNLAAGKKMVEDRNKKDDEKKAEDKKKEDATESDSKEDTQSQEKVTITVGVPPAPPTLPILHMMEDKTMGENVDIQIDLWTEPETLIAMVQDKEHDIFAVPLTVVCKLFNKGMDMRLMNVNTWGVDYFLTSDPDFKSWADLKGKTIYVPLQSSPVDALTQYLLDEAGLTPGEDVTIVYGSLVEVATMLMSGKAQYATLIEPQVSRVLMKNSDVRVAYSLEKEWQRVTGNTGSKPTAGIATTQHYIDANPALLDQFQEAYAEAVAWVNEHPKEAGQLAEKHLGLKAPLIMKALPNMGLKFKAAVDAKDEVNAFYQLLFDFNPKMVGGKLPEDALYYGK